MPREEHGVYEAHAFNVEFLQAFENVLKDVLDMYQDIQEVPGLSVQEGGSGTVFDQRALDEVLRNNGEEFSFSANLFLQDLRWRPFPLTPVNVQGIKELVQQHYSSGPPDRLSFGVTLVTDGREKDLMAAAGQLKRVSPEEPVWALLFAASKAEDQEQKRQYRRLLLNVRYTLLVKDNRSEILKECVSIRERIRDNARAVKRSALAMLMLIVSQKNEFEKALDQF